MVEFKKIYLAWRRGAGSRRHIVGVIERAADGLVTFQYLLSQAKKLIVTEGFLPYFEFRDLEKVYDQHVMAIFAQRLMKPERPDIDQFYDFWEVEHALENDRFYVLGKTQGLVATDNFEFLAEYEFSSNTHFLTDIAGLSHQLLPKGTIEAGDKLRAVLDTENVEDPEAVKVFAGDLHIGYIKKVHCKVFHFGPDDLHLQVKDIEQNGTIRKIFVRVAHKDLMSVHS